MTRKDKRIAALRTNLRGIRFDDACRIAETLGFTLKGGVGSHRTYGREGEPILLNFQDRNGFIKPYQAKQLLDMVNKYEDDS